MLNPSSPTPSTSQAPKVSVGLPVYNGENYLEEAIASILAQTLQDFELIISDNASNDRTAAICHTFAQKDPRIRYHRNPENIGGAPNFNRVVDLAQGQYFKWAAHDDRLAPTFLEHCVAALDANPDAVLAHSWTQIIDHQGHWLRNYRYDGKLDATASQPVQRFRGQIHPLHQCYQLFGVMRTTILRQTPLHGSYSHGDGVLLARLALLGPFCEIPEYLFFARTHPEQSMYRFLWTRKRPDYYGFTVWCDPTKVNRLLMPRWTILLEYQRAIAEVPLPPDDQRACYHETLKWAKNHWKGLLHDLGLAVLYPFQQAIQPLRNGWSPRGEPSKASG